MNLLTLAFACATFGPVQEAEPVASDRASAPRLDDPRIQSRMEGELGFAIYDPKHITSKSLLRYVKELTETKVQFFQEIPATGQIVTQRRDRFIPMEGLIGIQDFAEGRDQAIALLLDLDTRLHSALQEPDETPQRREDQVRAIRLRSLNLGTAQNLALNVSPALSVTLIEETGTVVLRGTVADVGYAETILNQADEPLPQVALRCMVIQPVDPNADDAPGTALTGEIADSLRALVPGKEFRNVGDLYLRGSAGGRSGFQVETSLPDLSPERSMPARLQLRTLPRGLDAKTDTLTLDACELQLEIPYFQTNSVDGATQTQLLGFHAETLSANLALRADETTVVGSLMGSSLYFALSFERAN